MRWLFLLAFLTWSADLLAQQETVNPEDLARLVRERNTHTQASEWYVRSAASRKGVLLRSYLPFVSAALGGELFRTGEHREYKDQPYAEARAEVNLFRGGQDYLRDKQAVLSHEAALGEADAVFSAELFKLRKAYWQLVFQREVEDFVQDAAVRNEDSRKAAQRRLSAGLGTDTDRMEFEIRATLLEQDLAKAKGEGRGAERLVRALLAKDDAADILTPRVLAHEHEDQIGERMFSASNVGSLRAMASEEHEKTLDGKAKFLWWTPSLTAYGIYQLETLREREFDHWKDRQDLAAGLKLSMQLFDGGESFREAAALRSEAKAFSLEAAQTRREMEAMFLSARDRLHTTHDLIDRAEKGVEQARRYLSATLSEYARGLKNSPDALGAHQRYYETLVRFAELKRDYQFAKAEMLHLLGE